jgi:regulatory protein
MADRGDEPVLDRASRLLARRSHARAELEAKLARGAAPEVAAAAVDLLAEHGIVDDEAHARALAARRLEQGYGPARIAHDLEQAGVEEGLRRAVVEALGPDDVLAAACRAIAGRERRPALARLWQRGFDEDVAERLGLLDG